MKRRALFAGLLAAVGIRAQEITQNDPVLGRQSIDERIGFVWDHDGNEVLVRKPDGNSFLGKRKSKPNQCPVCGTVAEPYKRKTEKAFYDGLAAEGWQSRCLPPEGNQALSVCRAPSETKLVGPMDRIMRCDRCNAAFWQDAEA